MGPDRAVARLHRVMEVKAFRVACGEFISSGDVEKEELEKAGLAVLPDGISYCEDMFAVRGRGTSMEPRVDDGDWCIFLPDIGGTRQNRIVLVEDTTQTGIESYTLKKYRSDKDEFPDGTWAHRAISLLPLNGSEHSPIHLDGNGNYRICGGLVGRVRHIQRIENYRYERFSEDI